MPTGDVTKYIDVTNDKGLVGLTNDIFDSS